eukprot:746463-Hanusia_phi.AAC.3
MKDARSCPMTLDVKVLNVISIDGTDKGIKSKALEQTSILTGLETFALSYKVSLLLSVRLSIGLAGGVALKYRVLAQGPDQVSLALPASLPLQGQRHLPALLLIAAADRRARAQRRLDLPSRNERISSAPRVCTGLLAQVLCIKFVSHRCLPLPCSLAQLGPA